MSAIPSISPVLFYADLRSRRPGSRKLLTERRDERVVGDDGSVLHAELSFGDGMILSTPYPPFAIPEEGKAPNSASTFPWTTHASIWRGPVRPARWSERVGIRTTGTRVYGARIRAAITGYSPNVERVMATHALRDGTETTLPARRRRAQLPRRLRRGQSAGRHGGVRRRSVLARTRARYSPTPRVVLLAFVLRARCAATAAYSDAPCSAPRRRVLSSSFVSSIRTGSGQVSAPR